MIGVKASIPKLRVRAFLRKYWCGRRVFQSADEGKGVTHAGAFGSKNVGTSNHNADEKSARRKIKVSFAMMTSAKG